MEQAALANAIGPGLISLDRTELDHYSHDMSFVNRVRPASVVKPKTAADVQKIVKFANETRTALVPVSSGPPHFRGDTVPSVGGAVIVDMSGMKKIMLVDRKRRVAMCEPGVTFAELIPEVEKSRAQAQYAVAAAEIQVRRRQHTGERACNHAQVSMGYLRPVGLRRDNLRNGRRV